MFTGIIEAIGEIKEIASSGSNKTFWIASPISDTLKIDQSVSHNGACLTVEAVDGNRHRITAIEETLKKTNLGEWKPGDLINLERCLSLNGRLDGHLVQGHVDATALCIDRKELNGSWEFRFRFPEAFAALVIEKGSIGLNGISLTIFNVTRSEFTVAVIPYTYEHTNIRNVSPGTVVNLEFDMMGKYVARMLELRTTN